MYSEYLYVSKKVILSQITFIDKLLHKETLAWCRAKSGTEVEYPDVVGCLHKTLMNMNVMVIWGFWWFLFFQGGMIAQHVPDFKMTFKEKN